MTDEARQASEPAVVLLVEDDEGDAVLVEAILAEADEPFTLHWVRSIADARPLLRKASCVLLDLNLPDATGFEALQAVRRVAPMTAVVVLTGQSDRSQGLEAVAHGAQDYLLKQDLEGQLLARSLRFAIERSRADAAARRLATSELLRAENLRLERGLLPRPLLHDPELAWASRYRPGGGRALLGGDFFDAVETDDGTVRLLIGDVCGHGPDEAALGVALRIAWRTMVLGGADEARFFPVLQDVLTTEREDVTRFVTAACVRIDPDRRRATVALAGHPAPLLLEPDRPAQLLDASHGPLLGVLTDATWPTHHVDLGDRWALLLYTDGLFEGRVRGSSERLGIEGLVALASDRHLDTDAADLVDDLVAATDVETSGVADDLAVLLLARGLHAA